jgi:hypothetical protein
VIINCEKLVVFYLLVTGSHKKDRASHEVRMVGIFCGWGYCPAELPVINLQAKPDHRYIKKNRDIHRMSLFESARYCEYSEYMVY